MEKLELPFKSHLICLVCEDIKIQNKYDICFDKIHLKKLINQMRRTANIFETYVILTSKKLRTGKFNYINPEN